MSSSFVICDSSGIITGTFATLSDAQADAQNLADAYASSDPNLSVQNTSTFYACVLLRTMTRDNSGISLTTTQQLIDKTWTIAEMLSPS